jgi:hypothetical protein
MIHNNEIGQIVMPPLPNKQAQATGFYVVTTLLFVGCCGLNTAGINFRNFFIAPGWSINHLISL